MRNTVRLDHLVAIAPFLTLMSGVALVLFGSCYHFFFRIPTKELPPETIGLFSEPLVFSGIVLTVPGLSILVLACILSWYDRWKRKRERNNNKTPPLDGG